jgi:ribosomal-protein-alanine N-acetyltransferase
VEREVNLRRIEPADAESVLEIQARSPEAAQWSRADYAADLEGWVAQEDGAVVGFLVARRFADELEILNVAVAPQARRKGIGSGLVQQALEWGRALGATRVFLEVRASNQAALRFYDVHGFRVTGRRARYYADPVEDALNLSAMLTGLKKGAPKLT